MKTWLKSLLVGGLMLLVLGAGVYLWDKQNTLFPLKKVVTEPSALQPEQQKQFQQVVKPYLGDSFWQVDLLQLQSDLARLEWVRSAAVSRFWPDTLKVRLVLQKPVVRWNENGLVNDAGQVFYPLDISPFENLVRLKGEDADAAEVLKALVVFQQRLQPLGMKIAQLELAPSGIWKITLLDGRTLVADREKGAEELRRFALAYPKVEKSYLKVAQGFDLRYSNGFIIKQQSPKKSEHGLATDGK